jgi:hypothetical protein
VVWSDEFVLLDLKRRRVLPVLAGHVEFARSGKTTISFLNRSRILRKEWLLLKHSDNKAKTTATETAARADAHVRRLPAGTCKA